MSEININSIIKLYADNEYCRVVFDAEAMKPSVSNNPPPIAINYAVILVQKSNLPYTRRKVVDVFLQLEALGAGTMSEGQGATEFQWSVNPVLLARVATGERSSL